jgi:uncharacterized membrane protein YphA (DoxX/SURF4 family)
MTNISTTSWSAKKKFTFLFLSLYTFFYIFPFPFDSFPGLEHFFSYYDRLTNAFTLWAGRHLFGITHIQKQQFSDSGDTIFDYSKVLVFFVVSLLMTCIILFADRKRSNYKNLNAWLFVYIRYCIGFYMLVYGFDKVFKSHFPFPSLEKLEQPFGQSSPQGLLWAFMGYSTTYTVYLGIIEVISGFLLFFRRTTTIGAILISAILLNVTILNFSYDVPVKLFALHLLAYAIILLSPYFRSIFNFFILQKEAKLPEQFRPDHPKLILNYRIPIKLIMIGAFTLLFMNFSIVNMRTDGDNAPKPPLYGIYKATGFSIHPGRFINKIIFDSKYSILNYEGRDHYYDTKIDTISKIIYLQSNSNASEKLRLNYELTNGSLTITENDSSVTAFKKINTQYYPLIRRKFHWVVEYPENY